MTTPKSGTDTNKRVRFFVDYYAGCFKLLIMTDKIYNIPAGCAFAEVLAEKFLNEYRGRDLELTDVLFCCRIAVP